MFEFFKRVKTIVSSELHHAIEKAEDPVKMLDQYVREMAKEIEDVERVTAKVIAEEKLHHKKVEELKAQIEKRESQALTALQAGKEDLARRTLEDKARLTKEAEQMDQLYLDIANQAEELKEKLKLMKVEFREMELKRDTLKSKAGAAQARTKMNRSLSSIQQDGARQGFERMEKKVLQYEAEAEASEDMRVATRSLDKELSELDQGSEIDNELERLKARLEEK